MNIRTRQTGWILFVVGLVISIVGIVWVLFQALQGGQPWNPLLADNVVFGQSVPFLLGLGVLIGLAHAVLDEGVRVERRSDGYIRRFNTSTVLNHWVNAIGFLLALGTGAVQYLVGVLDVAAPLPLYVFYRLHYIGAALIILATSSFITHRLLTGDRRILPERGRIFHEIRGLVEELPRSLGVTLASIVGINLRRSPPPTKQFTFYERLVSFPIWAVLIGLILVTGLIKAIRYVYPVPGTVLFWASTLHVAGMILVGAKLLDHLRYVLAPSRWPLFVSMFTGWIPEQYAQEHHPAWYAELQEAHRQRVESPADEEPEPATAQAVDV